MSPRLCLNMIVKNEIANLPRALASVAPHVTVAVIVDTGSTDGTPEFIAAFFKERNIQCVVQRTTFVNFEQARNSALLYARVHQRLWDYLLLMDADMELKVEGPLPPLTAESYAMIQRSGDLAYHNVRLLRNGSKAWYHGVTHEYLGADEQTLLPSDTWWFLDHATGSNRGDKYERDTRLLEDYLVQHPDDARTLFYLGQTLKDRGLHKAAIEKYDRRVDVGGWDEEVWYARLQKARSTRALGDDAGFVTYALAAYNARPQRAEPLYDLARYYREQRDQQQTAWLFADAGSKITYPKDMLFVEQSIYDWGFLHEKSILGFYSDKTRAEGFRACDQLSLMQRVPAEVREGARRNLFYYLRPLVEVASSFKAVRIANVASEAGYTNSNPSIFVSQDGIQAVVRTVSYRIRPDGSYDYNGFNAIRTTNYLCNFSSDLTLQSALKLRRPTGLPEPVFSDVLDVEDMRLYEKDGDLWANGCMLEQNPQAWREQFVMKINQKTGELTDCTRVEPVGLPKQNEKNWMPIVGREGRFMYRPGMVMNSSGEFEHAQPPTIAVDQFSGGGQLVPFDGGWVAIVHEARPDPTNGKRFYQHRFVWFDEKFALTKYSRPFVFFEKQIEFAMGLAWHPADGTMLVSFGVLDREAWIGKLAAQDIRDLIWHS
jgi:glycosyltransferase involved in cell wall biosynthesis